MPIFATRRAKDAPWTTQMHWRRKGTTTKTFKCITMSKKFQMVIPTRIRAGRYTSSALCFISIIFMFWGAT